MRINQFIARQTGVSRRQADKLINTGQITINGQKALIGQVVAQNDEVSLGDKPLNITATVTIMLNKPIGFVCSRRGQGARTVYELLPEEFNTLKTIGRLDKNSSGLILLSNDGKLAYELTHPSRQKNKKYIVELNAEMNKTDLKKLIKGIMLDDGLSNFKSVKNLDNNQLELWMGEGRNRQIRRTMAALGYKVVKLHRLQFGPYDLGRLAPGHYKQL